MRPVEFIERINKIQTQKRIPSNLEAFLCGMWASSLKYHDLEPSWELFLQIISDGWTTTGMNFDTSWLSIVKSSDLIEIETNTRMDDFDYLKGTILYQIADLHRMRDAGYYEKDPMLLYFGLESPTGATWYNWTIEGFLEAANAPMDSDTADDMELEQATWRDLAELLILGQIYE